MNDVFVLFVGVSTLLLYVIMAFTNLWIARRHVYASLRQLKQEEERRGEQKRCQRWLDRWFKKNTGKIAKCWRNAYIEVGVINILEYYLMTTFQKVGTCLGFFMLILSGFILLSIIINLLKKESEIFNNIGEPTDIVMVCVPIMSLAFLFPINLNGWTDLNIFPIVLTNVEMAFVMWTVLNMNSEESFEQKLEKFLKYSKDGTQAKRKEFKSRRRTNKAAISLK